MKIPYARVSLEVEKIYASIENEQQLEKGCRVISILLEACGWDENEYWQQRMSQEGGLDKEPSTPYIVQERTLS